MQFTTQIPVAVNNQQIDYNSRIVSLGSCFAVNIGRRLEYFKFRNITNPFGILFHPLALQKAIGFALNNKTFSEADIFFHNERWQCYDAHSDLSHNDPAALTERLNKANALLRENLLNASHIIITLGTAWVYQLNATGETVANCHKVPQQQFTKHLMSVNDSKQSLTAIIDLIRQANPTAQLIFTISPVRHIKDGFTENQHSKSNLFSALQDVLQSENYYSGTFYFPSYEIMMDELRDYRFYAADMIHPNETAIAYIWERFTESCIKPEAFTIMKEADTIQKGLLHRPFNAESDQHKDFLRKLSDRAEKLNQQYPHITF
ncbi:GSCFA domain-containing protein [Flavobacterium sp.]|uniref:GSCFA domain-containing protein n=1 Tax=Flavobacterium sp. TaxID=239 RepID=UPI0026178FAB|nr:GSCFA domain-containing protein [Flavobacterium sp.]